MVYQGVMHRWMCSSLLRTNWKSRKAAWSMLFLGKPNLICSLDLQGTSKAVKSDSTATFPVLKRAGDLVTPDTDQHHMPHNDPNSLPIYSHATANPVPSHIQRIKYNFKINLFLNEEVRL